MGLFNKYFLKKHIHTYKAGKNPEKLIKRLKKQRLLSLVKYLLTNTPDIFEGVMLIYFENYTKRRLSGSYQALQKVVLHFENDLPILQRLLIFFYRYVEIDLVSFYARQGQKGHIKQTLLHQFARFPGLLTLNVNGLVSYEGRSVMELYSKKFQSQGATKAVFQDARFFELYDGDDFEYRPPESWEWLSQVKLSAEEAYTQNFKFLRKNIMRVLLQGSERISKIINQHRECFESLDFKELMSDIWNRSGFNLNCLLSATFPKWKDFTYQDWVDILEELKNNGDALFEFFTFAYEYLGIDLMAHYVHLTDVDEEIRHWVLHYIANSPGMLAYFESDKEKPFNQAISSEKLQKIQAKLLSEGATKAIPINGEDFITDKNSSILSVPVNGKPLEGWEWAKGYEA